MKKLSRIVRDPEICGGQPTIKGTRVLVLDIVSLLKMGQSFTEILEAFPTITKEDIQDILSYAEALIAGESVTYVTREDAVTT